MLNSEQNYIILYHSQGINILYLLLLQLCDIIDHRKLNKIKMTEKSRVALGNQTRPPQDATEYMSGLNGELGSYPVTAAWFEMERIGEGGVLTEDAVYAHIDAASGDGRFAVFDGASGSNLTKKSGDARIAAQAARQELHENALYNGDTVLLDPSATMTALFDRMAARVSGETHYGYATGFVGFVIHTEQGLVFEWGAVGNSLGFILRGDQLIQLNREETKRQEALDIGFEEKIADRWGNIITNALGGNEYAGLKQRGSEPLQDGDLLILTTNGVTGDRANQRMKGGDNEQAIKNIMNLQGLSIHARAELLVTHATNEDDRSALIVEIGNRRIAALPLSRTLAYSSESPARGVTPAEEAQAPFAPSRRLRSSGRVGSSVLNHLRRSRKNGSSK